MQNERLLTEQTEKLRDETLLSNVESEMSEKAATVCIYKKRKKKKKIKKIRYVMKKTKVHIL